MSAENSIELNLRAYSDGEEIVVCGTPECEECWPDEETGHNCDGQGCGWDHVIFRASLEELPEELQRAIQCKLAHEPQIITQEQAQKRLESKPKRSP